MVSLVNNICSINFSSILSGYICYEMKIGACMKMEKKKHLVLVGAHCGDVEIQGGAIAHKYAKAGSGCNLPPSNGWRER